ncbi:chitin binding peritrophin-A domain-containing protein [Yoonia sp. 208BN28-4]|uniref:chitin binding peritrophin-A domain-containing protein n=1 Tax=Yoonia sp. 208BN28-4 TaxID=3126505 RepID=UPI00309FD143
MNLVRTTLIAALMPVAAFAAGSNDTAPKPSETTQQCAEGLVFDLATQSCMTPEQSTNDDSAMMDIVRELAHFGRYADALGVLGTLENQQSDLALTYYGFVNRKAGDMDLGMAFYDQAIAQNPDNILARSYMGQALVEQGAYELAAAQLIEIRLRGGRGTWAEASLDSAIATGETYTF